MSATIMPEEQKLKDKVSIIIPTYNGVETIQETLNSVLLQTYKNYEIIIVDDGSTDNTVEFVRSKFSNIHIIQQKNQGTLGARQRGLDVAHGEFIAFLDQDDTWFEEALQKRIAILLKKPEIGLLLANMKCINDNGNLLDFNVVPDSKCYTPSWEELVLFHPIANSVALFRRDALSKIGILDKAFGFSGALGDTDTFARIAEYTDVYFFNDCLGYYRWSEARPGRLVSFLDNLQIYAKKYSQHPRLSNANNMELRTKFVLACCNYAIHIYRLLLSQYNHKIPAELLSKLNKHNETMGVLFGSIYETHIALKPINFNLLNLKQESQRTLLFLYLLRSDLQKVFPEVIQGNLNNLLEWASAVVQQYHSDGDFHILDTFASELILEENNSIQQRWKFTRISWGKKRRGFLSSLLQVALPLHSRRRHLFHPLIAGVRTIFDEGWKSFFKKLYRYVFSKFRPIATRWLESLSKAKQEILFAKSLGKRLSFPVYDSPDVAVIVKVGKNKRVAHRCLANLLIHSQIPYKAYVLYDNTEPTINDYVGRLKNVVKKAVSEDIGSDVEIYGLLANEFSCEKYILFLSDNAIVTENYLDPMISMLEADIKYGVITGKVVEQSSKKLLYAGRVLKSDDQLLYHGLGDDPDKPEYSYVRSVDSVFSNFYMIRREILDYFLNSEFIQGEIGYFRMIQEQGYNIQYQPNSIIYWDTPKYPKLNMGQNGETPRPLPDNLVSSDVQSAKKVLVIDDYIPAIRYGSGFPRLYKMLTCLSDLDYQVTFFPVGNSVKVQPETSELQQKGVEVLWGNHANFDEFVRSRAGYYDAVLISRPHVFERIYPSIIRSFPKAAILYDAEALFYARDIVKAEISGEIMQESDKTRIAHKEMQLIEKADVVISVSQQTKDIMLKNSLQKNIEVWEYIQEVLVSNVPFGQRQGMLHFGSFFAGPGSPNEDAVLYFAREVLPEIQSKLPSTLYVVGTSPTSAVMELAGTGIEVVGYVESPKTYFDMCRVNVVPTRIFATGTPLKLIEAMSYGIPSVVTGSIARHLGLVDGKEVMVADTNIEFAMKVVQLYSDESLWQSLHRNSINYIIENYSYERMKQRLDVAIQRGLQIRSRKKA